VEEKYLPSKKNEKQEKENGSTAFDFEVVEQA
jgi:hypothetical protein